MNPLELPSLGQQERLEEFLDALLKPESRSFRVVAFKSMLNAAQVTLFKPSPVSSI